MVGCGIFVAGWCKRCIGILVHTIYIFFFLFGHKGPPSGEGAVGLKCRGVYTIYCIWFMAPEAIRIYHVYK